MIFKLSALANVQGGSMRIWLVAVGSGIVAACRAQSVEPPVEPAPAVAVTAVPPAPQKAPIEALAMQPLVADAREGSGVVLARVAGRALAFVSDPDEQMVHTIDVDERVELAHTFVPGKPERMLVVGDRLAVALRDKGVVLLLAATAVDAPLEDDARLLTADEPVALARTPDHKELWVASGWGRTLEGFTVGDRHLFARIPLAREPRAITIEKNARRAFVGYLNDGAVDAVNLEDRTITPHSLGAAGTVAIRQTFALVRAPLGTSEAVIAPHVRVNTGNPHAPTDGYGSQVSDISPVVFNLASVDVTSLTVPVVAPPVARLDDCRLPRDAATFGSSVAVACFGSDNIKTYAAHGPRNMLATIAIPGGPQALAFDGKDRLIASTLFDRKVWFVSADGKKKSSLNLFHLDGRGLPRNLAEGRRLFHRATDTRISADGRACASCHPDGRDDGLVWPTPDGPRKTMFLAGRLARGKSFGWEAKHATMPIHIHATIKNLKGAGLAAEEVQNIAAYCASMTPPPRTPRALTTDEEHGREIFRFSAGCGGCHAEESHFTDASSHDVSSATVTDKTKTFLAPSLKYLAGTARLFHDGRYADLSTLLRSEDGKMGATAHLSKKDLRDLEAYLQTL
jgi:mono/diheme cytochrome c family protein